MQSMLNAKPLNFVIEGKRLPILASFSLGINIFLRDFFFFFFFLFSINQINLVDFPFTLINENRLLDVRDNTDKNRLT